MKATLPRVQVEPAVADAETVDSSPEKYTAAWKRGRKRGAAPGAGSSDPTLQRPPPLPPAPFPPPPLPPPPTAKKRPGAPTTLPERKRPRPHGTVCDAMVDAEVARARVAHSEAARVQAAHSGDARARAARAALAKCTADWAQRAEAQQAEAQEAADQEAAAQKAVALADEAEAAALEAAALSDEEEAAALADVEEAAYLEAVAQEAAAQAAVAQEAVDREEEEKWDQPLPRGWSSSSSAWPVVFRRDRPWARGDHTGRSDEAYNARRRAKDERWERRWEARWDMETKESQGSENSVLNAH
jgi:hypothetical protein